jgi:hypothetical protein
MKTLFSILLFLVTSTTHAQRVWKFTADKERLYKEIADSFPTQEWGRFIDTEDDRWKKTDSFFRDMPLKIALNYYIDSFYSIKYYSFLKILGQNDTLAFKLLSRYISDSTKIIYQVDDIGGEVAFNELLARAYESFIDSKYYWCDTKGILYKSYFRKTPFVFSKMNYVKWPSILTNFTELIKPWNIKHTHDISELKHYRGVKDFYGR